MYRMALMALIAGDVPGLNRERFHIEILFISCYMNSYDARLCFRVGSLVCFIMRL